MHTFRKFLSCLAIGTVVVSAKPTRADPAVLSARVRADVNGLHSPKGQTLCLLYNSSDGFPRNPEKAVRRAASPIVNGSAVCAFPDVPPGVYAVLAMHDENGDGKMNRSLFGMPIEGHGASNDSHGGPFGSPTFAGASFSVVPGQTTIVSVPIHY